MSTSHTGQTQPSIDLEEHRSVGGVNVKAVTIYNYDVNSGTLTPASGTLTGAGTDTTLTLTVAATSYQVPASPPASAYLLLLYNGSDTDMFITFTSATSGGIKLAAGANLNIDLGASQTLFAYSSGTGKVLNVSYKVI